MKILDVGCGGGILAEGLARRGATVMAIDPNVELLEVAESRRKRYGLDNLSYHDFLIQDLQGKIGIESSELKSLVFAVFLCYFRGYEKILSLATVFLT